MKNLSLLIVLLILTSCKEKVQEPKLYADVDSTSNQVVHLTNADDIYYSLESAIAQNEGKIVYVNFFDSTTDVTLMRGVETIYKELDKNKFAIVNIMTDPSMMRFENHLNITIMPQNFLARNFPEADFYLENDFKIIPRYMIYDKNGKLIDNNAMRPDNDNLLSTLQLLISQE